MSKQKYPTTSATTTVDGAPGKRRAHYSHAKADAKCDKRRREAKERQRHYESLSVTARIKLAESRRGESKQELVRLNKLLIAKPVTIPIPAPAATTIQSEKKPKRTPKSKVIKAAKLEHPSKS